MSTYDHSRSLIAHDPVQARAACPFCASPDVGFYEHVYAKHFAMMCHRCGAEGPLRPSIEEAGRLWNGRVHEP